MNAEKIVQTKSGKRLEATSPTALLVHSATPLLEDAHFSKHALAYSSHSALINSDAGLNRLTSSLLD